jgi:hypothetical protein
MYLQSVIRQLLRLYQGADIVLVVTCIFLYIPEQKTLEGFVEVAQSSYGCILIHKRLYVATESWLVHTHTYTHRHHNSMHVLVLYLTEYM